jgi:serine/threonine protein kinase
LHRRLLGGGMGTVWVAYDKVLERQVVAKALIFEADRGDDLRDVRERMRREALALALVDHPAVVTVHDLIYDGEDPWIVMGYVDGPTLARYIDENPRLPAQEIASIGLVVLQGLLACHAKKVFHRDVKPANIIRTPEGSARLVDFGIARIGGMRTLTPKSKIIGTPEYMAPELFEGQAGSQRTDLWALGATLYYALEGRPPFTGANLAEIMRVICSEKPPSPPRNKGLLADLVLAMLRKAPSARPDAMAVLNELRKAAGSGAPARRPVWQDRLQRTEPHNAHQVPTQPRKPPISMDASWQPLLLAEPLGRLSGVREDEAAKIIARLPPDDAIADLFALKGEEAAKILLQCDGAVAGRLLSLAAAKQPAWTRKIIEMVARTRAGQLLNKMTVEASAAALAIPPTEVAAQVLSRADDATINAVLSELSRQWPSRGAPLVLALDDLEASRVVEAGRVATVLGQSAPVTVARLLHYVNTPARRESLLSRLPWQFRPLVEKHLTAMADSD